MSSMPKWSDDVVDCLCRNPSCGVLVINYTLSTFGLVHTGSVIFVNLQIYCLWLTIGGLASRHQLTDEVQSTVVQSTL
jgi:hypothetical protein